MQSINDPRPRRRESDRRWSEFTTSAANWYLHRMMTGAGPIEWRA